jgi:hypothetical protein
MLFFLDDRLIPFSNRRFRHLNITNLLRNFNPDLRKKQLLFRYIMFPGGSLTKIHELLGAARTRTKSNDNNKDLAATQRRHYMPGYGQESGNWNFGQK